jgi:hypothetical protein
MKYIEDFVQLFAIGQIHLSTFDEKIASSLGWQCVENKAFTQKQAEIALRLLKKYKKQFLTLGHENIELLIDAPVYKYALRVIDNQSAVSLDYKDQKFRVKFPFNQELVTKIRQFSSKTTLTKPSWDPETKTWQFDLNEKSLEFIFNELLPLKFEVTDEISEILEKYQKIKENFEDYVPMLVKHHDSYCFKNIKSNFSSTDLTSALIESVKLAVSVYDDQIYEEIDIVGSEYPMYNIFKQHEKQNFVLPKEKYSRTQILHFMKDMDTINVIFLHENANAETLKNWIFDLESCGISLSDVAVLFRQNNEGQGVEFNSVVKSYNLNKSTQDNVKWIFLGGKYPKSLVKNEKIANICLFENQYVYTHHTIQSIMKNSIFNFAHNEHTKQGDGFVVL